MKIEVISIERNSSGEYCLVPYILEGSEFVWRRDILGVGTLEEIRKLAKIHAFTFGEFEKFLDMSFNMYKYPILEVEKFYGDL